MDKNSSISDVKQKIESLTDPSTSLETKMSNIEYLLSSSVKNRDFANFVKESNGILSLSVLSKNANDLELKTKASVLLNFLSLSGHTGESTEKLISDFNVMSLVNFFQEKDFGIFMQVFNSLKILGDGPLKAADGSSSIPKSSISFTLSAAVNFLTNFTALIDPSSKMLTDGQKAEMLVSFTQFVMTGVMAQAADDAAKDSSTASSKDFSLAYQKFVKTAESLRKGDFSMLDMVVNQLLQLTKDGRLITAGMLEERLSIISDWIGGSKKFVLLYQATRDGFSAAAFHGKCDNKGATVTIITSSEGFVFGGYTPLQWNGSTNTYIPDSSHQSLVFSLKNPRNEKPAKFSHVNNGNNQNAIYSGTNYGPTFSGGHTIYCSDNSNTYNSNYTNLTGTNYVNTTGVDAQTVFTGKYNFTAKEIEVYQVQ